MKKVTFLAVCVIAGLFTHAQISFGAKGGLNLSNFSGNHPWDKKMKPGFHIGGLVHIPVAKQLSVQPELQYSSEGSKLNAKNYNLGYINIPVLLKYTHASGFYGEAGPQIAFMMAAKYDGADVKSGLNKTNIGIGFGLGYTMESGFGFGARYNIGFTNILKGSVELIPNNIGIGLHYIFSSSHSAKIK